VTARKKGLRAALAAKTTRVEHYDIPVVDSSTVDKIVTRLNQARQLSLMANLGDDKAAKDRAVAELAAVQTELDACFHRVEFTGLTSDADLDALLNAYPATAEQKAKDPDATTDPDGFNLALLVACVVDGDGMTVEDWREELWSPKWTRADRNALFQAVSAANQREFSADIPKD